MGQELACKLKLQKRALSGKAYLETDHLLFRGDERVKVLFRELTGVKAAGGVLRLEFEGGPAELELGAAAEKWADKILHPPSRLDKLGVKAGTVFRLVGDLPEDFSQELLAAGTSEAPKTGHAALVFLGANKTADLSKVKKLSERLVPDGAIWVVYPKGVKEIREIEVIEAGRAAGLKDVKVASFSSTHTGLKFVIPVAKRPAI